MSVNVVYEGLVLAREVMPRMEGDAWFVPLGAPMPVGTRLAVERGESRTYARVSHVVETGESGVVLVGESGERLMLDETLAAMGAPEPLPAHLLEALLGPAPTPAEAKPQVVEASALTTIVDAAPAPSIAPSIAPAPAPAIAPAIAPATTSPPVAAAPAVVVVEAPPLPADAEGEAASAADEGAAATETAPSGEGGDKNGKSGGAAGKRRGKRARR